MKKQFLVAASIVSAATILLCGCQKNLQLKNSEEELRGTPLPGQENYCRIESIWEKPGYFLKERFLLVLYDEYENPIAVTTPEVGTGQSYCTFKYDDWHRLKEYRGEYSNGFFEFWHFYGFDLNGRIAVDTAYFWGRLSNKPIDYLERTFSKFEYDNQNRIIKAVTDYEVNHFHFEDIYVYDAAGNLTYPPNSGVTYDNKVNLHRTNDIWMFLARDYSRNNPFIASAYNSTGFPTIIDVGIPRDFVFANTSSLLNHSQLSYSCRQAYW